MASNPNVSELRKTSDVTDDDITAAVDAVLADLATESYPLAKEWTLDLVAALANHKAPRMSSSPTGTPISATWSAPRSCWRIW